MQIELIKEINAATVPSILELEYEASRPLYEFVYRDEAEARTAQRVLWDAGAAEWCPPHLLVVTLDGAFAGLVGGLTFKELKTVRLASSLALGRAGMLKDEKRSSRMQAALESLVQPQEGDFYFPVIGMISSVRGTGYIPELFELLRAHARESGAGREVFQASADMPGLVRMYERTDHYRIGDGRASDPETGHSLHYIHFAFDL